VQKKVSSLLKSSYFSYFVLAVGLSLSVLTAWHSALWIETYEKQRFDAASDKIVFLAQRQVQATMQTACSSAAFFKASPEASKESWKVFIDAHDLKKRFPSIELIGYAPVLPSEQRTQYEKKMRLEGVKDYTIFPSTPTAYLAPITYIEPLTPINAKALGFNAASEPMRLETMEKALQRGVGTLSPLVEFILDAHYEEKIGFIVFAPIFKNGAVLESLEQKRENLTGYIIAGIRAKSLFENLLGKPYEKIDYEIFDGTIMDKTSKLYDSAPELTNTRYEYVRTVGFYGREWIFRFKSDEVLNMNWSRYAPYSELLFGILFSLVIGRWIHALQRTREEAYKIANEQTKRLAHSEAAVRTVFQAMHEGVMVQNAQGVITECNLAAQEIFGMTKDEILGRVNNDARWSAIKEDGSVLPTLERPSVKALRTGKAQENVIMGVVREGSSIVWVQANAEPLFSDDFSHVESVVVTLSNITQFRKSKLKLEEYIAIIDANVIISSTDLEGIITEVSEAFCAISGYSKEELMGKNHNIVRHSDMPDSLYAQMWETLKSGKTWVGEMKNRHKNGTDYWVDATISPRFNDVGVMVGYTAIRQDITDKKRIEELSITDRLTGLYNRLKLDEMLSLHVSMAHRHKTPFSVIMLDIDKFKSVNDTYGHQVGDTLLQEIASVLKTNIRLEDVLGRWGGEEFLILLPNMTCEGALLLAEKLRLAIETYSFSTVGSRTSSFGVASYTQSDNTKTIVGRADEALYRAKANGRNRVEAEIHTCDLAL